MPMGEVKVEVVLVRRFIKAGREDEFFAVYKSQDPRGRKGFIDERLFKCKTQDEPGVTKFINIGWWDSQEDFEAIPGFGSEPPPAAAYEARKRERDWLSPQELTWG